MYLVPVKNVPVPYRRTARPSGITARSVLENRSSEQLPTPDCSSLGASLTDPKLPNSQPRGWKTDMIPLEGRPSLEVCVQSWRLDYVLACV